MHLKPPQDPHENAPPRSPPSRTQTFPTSPRRLLRLRQRRWQSRTRRRRLLAWSQYARPRREQSVQHVGPRLSVEGRRGGSHQRGPRPAREMTLEVTPRREAQLACDRRRGLIRGAGPLQAIQPRPTTTRLHHNDPRPTTTRQHLNDPLPLPTTTSAPRSTRSRTRLSSISS